MEAEYVEAPLLLKQKRSYACCHVLGVTCETAVLLIAARFSSFQPRVSVYAHLVSSSSTLVFLLPAVWQIRR